MEEIAERFKEEFSELLSRYKEHLSNTRIISILQSVTRKQIGFKDIPERLERIFNNTVHNLVNVNGLEVPSELLEEPDPELRKMIQGEVERIDPEEHLNEIVKLRAKLFGKVIV